MASAAELIKYAQYATGTMLATEGVDQDGQPFVGGLNSTRAFRPTQREAIEAYDRFLRSKRASKKQLTGYLEIPTGVGKTALFATFTRRAFEGAFKAHGILPPQGTLASLSHRQFKAHPDLLRTMIIVPTTNLLKQTYEEFDEYAPELHPYVGQYGGRHRQLNKPVTIITYSSWKQLVESGALTGNEADILISDEAHRGLSERSQIALLRKFNGDTLKLAFTATARYDEQKTLKHTHKNEIYSLPISESIRRGELANYVQTQFYVIRVAPPKPDPDKPDQTYDTRRLRQEGWNRRAVKIFREGTDQHTGDALTDNQAAFFVEDIYQANRVAQLLNDDPELAALAKQRGCKGVAVAIHSKLSDKNQEALMDEYKAGQWMSIVGDEKFKEGFDHKPLKTMIDWAHGSLVDKAQILGRGARQWFNPVKQRSEGLTFCDTVVYVGSEDKAEDGRLRDKAIRNAILASDILEDSVVLSPGTLPSSRPGTSLGGGTIFADDPDVEEYTSLEQIRTFLGIREKLIFRVPITEEMRQKLIDEINRTGMAAQAIFKFVQHPPKGLTWHQITTWSNGTVTSVPEAYWQSVINAYEQQPDQKYTILITSQMSQMLKSEIDRTGVGAQKLFNTLKNLPVESNHDAIRSWVRGTTRQAHPEFWGCVMRAYAALPDASRKIKITDEMRQKLCSKMERTGKKGTAIIINMDKIPAGLTHHKIDLWAAGKTKTAEAAHWELVMEAYSNCDGIFKITDEMRQELARQRERTSIGPQALLAMSENIPDGLTLAIIQGWGQAKFADPDYWQFVTAKYKSIPSVAEKIEITDEMRQLLCSEMERTLVLSQGLSTFMKKELGENLSPNSINGWKDGSITSAKKSDWDCAIKAYSLLPDKVEITDEMRKELLAEVERTAVGAEKLFKKALDQPEGFNASIAKKWERGEVKTAIKAHWEYTMRAYQKVPSIFRITSEARNKLASEMERTGVGSINLLKIFTPPEGINKAKIISWKDGRAKTADPECWNFVMNAYGSLPNKGLDSSPSP